MPGTPLSTRSPKLDGANPKNDPIRNIATTKTRIDPPMKGRSVSACSNHICYGRPVEAYDLWQSVRITCAIVREIGALWTHSQMFWHYSGRAPIRPVASTRVENGQFSSHDMKASSVTPWSL